MLKAIDHHEHIGNAGHGAKLIDEWQIALSADAEGLRDRRSNPMVVS